MFLFLYKYENEFKSYGATLENECLSLVKLKPGTCQPENSKISPIPFMSQIKKYSIKKLKKSRFRIRIQCKFRKKVIVVLGLHPKVTKNGS